MNRPSISNFTCTRSGIFTLKTSHTDLTMLGKNHVIKCDNQHQTPVKTKRKTHEREKSKSCENNGNASRAGLHLDCHDCENSTTDIVNNFNSKLSDISITSKDSINTGKPKTIIVEGNIGCGKSTLLEHFSKKDGIKVFPEPVHKWRDNRGENMLELFYQDPGRWSFAFESYNQFTLLQEHQAQPNCRIKMMERSIYCGKYCFIQSLYESNKLEELEYNILTEWFDWLITKDVHVDHIVYLRSTPELCHERIAQRSRTEESGIPLEYLKDLHERHEDWLIRNKFKLPAPVIILDATKPLDEMKEQFKILEEKLKFYQL